MQDLTVHTPKEVASARVQNKLLRDTLARLKAQTISKSHTGNLQDSLRSFLDLITEERQLMESLETDLARNQMKYEQLLSDTVSDVKSTLRTTKGPNTGLALLLEREHSEIAEWRRKIDCEVKSMSEMLTQLTVTEIEQDAELTLKSTDGSTPTPRPRMPTLHKSGARINESHRSPLLKPIDSRRE